MTEPPITKGRDVTKYLDTPLITNYPCHTQSVERAVALSSSSVKRKTGLKRQRNAALVKAKSRKEMKGKMTRQKLADYLAATKE